MPAMGVQMLVVMEAPPTTPATSLMSEAALVVIDVMYWQKRTVGCAKGTLSLAGSM